MINLYNEVKKRIDTLDLNKLWSGFKPYPFAFYDETKVYIDGKLMDKDEQFRGNSVINYNGRNIVIWDTRYETKNVDDLASKIIHEMFHMFQIENKETRWMNDMEAILHYEYRLDNLSIKYEENKIIYQLLNQFDHDLYHQFLTLRKYREKHFPYEFDYETKLEVIEGMAQYLELKALKELNLTTYQEIIKEFKEEIMDASRLIPIRTISYHLGSLILIMCDENQIPVYHEIGHTQETLFEQLAKNIPYSPTQIDNNTLIKKLLNEYNQKNENEITSFINNANNKINGNYALCGLDPQNAYKFENYLYCKNFMVYCKNGESHLINKGCVARFDEQFNIIDIYY